MLAEIHSAGKLAHYQQIDSVADDLGLERRSAPERTPHRGRTQISEKTKLFAQGQQRALLGALGAWKRIPLRPAYSSEQNRVGALARRQRILGQAVAEQVVCGTSYQLLVEQKLVTEPTGDFRQYLYSLAHDFWADAIACNYRYFLLHNLRFPLLLIRLARAHRQRNELRSIRQPHQPNALCAATVNSNLANR